MLLYKYFLKFFFDSYAICIPWRYDSFSTIMTNAVIKMAFPIKMTNLATTYYTSHWTFSYHFPCCGAALLPISLLYVVLRWMCVSFAIHCSFPLLDLLCIRDAALLSVDSITSPPRWRLNPSLAVIFAWLTCSCCHWLVHHGANHWDWFQIHSMWRDSSTLILVLRC